jgi:cyanophycinase
MKPKGILLIIGGSEDKGAENTPDIAGKNVEYEKFEILKELIQGHSKTKKIEVITTASETPDEIRKMYKKTFKEIGYSNIGFLNIENKIDANDQKNIKRVEEAHAILFSGGDQFRISTIIGGTSISETIRDRYYNDENFVVAGTSAGAMVISRVMIIEGGVEEALVDTDVKTTSGLGLLETCIIDTHFIKRGRFGRLAHAVIINPGQLGIGLGEDTALIVKEGDKTECRGSGMVVIIDGKDILQTNITDVQDEHRPIYVENLKVHLLVKNCRFDLNTRRLAVPAIARNKKGK